jgi:hypothetical protein
MSWTPPVRGEPAIYHSHPTPTTIRNQVADESRYWGYHIAVIRTAETLALPVEEVEAACRTTRAVTPWTWDDLEGLA